MSASTSAWSWSPEHQLYFNLSTQVWASPQPDGTWVYSDSTAAADDPAAEREEGEDVDGTAIPAEQVWPGDADADADADEPAPETVFAQAPLLRLVVLESSILKPPQTVALVDPADGVSLGRDRTFEKRIRLPELSVSKSHATVCWMQPGLDEGPMSDGGWAACDNGSTHGTWLKQPGGASTRLSAPKMASGPRELKHLDTLTVGRSSFTVHIHASYPCEACSVAPDGSNAIPLTADASSVSSPAPSTEGYSTRTKAEKEKERRAKMKGLKDQFLAAPVAKSGGSIESRKKAAMLAASTSATGSQVHPAVQQSTEPTKPVFIDRAAARRARTGTTAKPAGPSPFFAVPGRTLASSAGATTFASPVPQSVPANPFATSSRGAQLLSKLTRPAGDGATAEAGLGTLIQPRTFDTASTGRDERPGLGSKPLVVIGQPNVSAGTGGPPGKRGWRDDVREANRKRFKELEGGGQPK